ncbi:hypothetical protein OsI_12573 [Oryza sativa Indica Group]|uniref:F-box domain-containing protein n=1 Tax=Oryza sativa subsp. indica TaxID=39946 RepID=A2XJE9_ORYSI|nr:hypothetical protein OsI_12573 [Oryza sativa Indica Group]
MELPDDMITEVLRRLPPRSLAACRRVCRSWRAVVDDRRLLREDLLPLSLAGIFLNLHDLYPTQFFSCPSATGPAVSGNVDYTRRRSSLPDGHMPSINITDHCNGLVLVNNCVTNPATRRWERLPRRHPRHVARTAAARFNAVHEHLVFDPAVSPGGYEVFLIPHVAPRERDRRRRRRDDEFYPTSDESEWPPSPFFLSVFSSETRQWEGRRFVRDGPPAGTVASMRLHHASEVGRGVYWRGSLYIHCQTNFVMRISLSSDKYQVIGPPLSFDVCRYKEFHLGRSEKGVYFALLSSNQLRIWFLEESCGQMGWVLKLDNNLMPILPHFINVKLSDDGPWSLQDIDYCEDPNEDDDARSQTVQAAYYDWDFDNSANSIDIQDNSVQGSHRGFGFLGFHPFKEVVFLHYSLERGLAYNMNSFKVQDLGNLCPKDYGFDTEPYVESFFPYTPCWMEVFPEEQT